MRPKIPLSPLLLMPLAGCLIGQPGAAYASMIQSSNPVDNDHGAWHGPGMMYVDTVHPGQPPLEPADQPLARTDANSLKAHQQLLTKRTQGRIDVYFMGDSITRRWGTSDRQYADNLQNWNENFKGWNAADFGWGGDKTQNMLWRLQQGELDGVNPKVIVLMAGTNNIGNLSPADDTEVRAAETVRGVAAVVKELRARAPQATVVLMGITPRSDNIKVMPIVDAANRGLARLADGHRIRYLNINARLTDGHGVLLPGMTSDGLHLTAKAYQLWADALKPILAQRLGPKAQEDQAPPPSGDPSAN
ncbi:MAG TPA: GDSL-type esterase/lipase family protein [Steroidobacteraceae bacterium]|jgi:lysophospholipase L1-like esterase|nr:GDSL-type esterase/lipase family protein [Steroidobacteraceae bacterium]